MTSTPETPADAPEHDERVHVCPECAAGKHGNCDGGAWCDVHDEPTSCACPECYVVPTEPEHATDADIIEATGGDAADVAVARMHRPTKAPADHRPKADDGTRTLHAEQLVDKVLERTGGGLGVVTFIGTMLGQLGEHVEANGLTVDWESALIYAKRTDAAGLEAGTHNIVPKGTLILVLDVNVRPSR